MTKKIVIIGTGYSGIVLAHELLLHSNHQVQIFGLEENDGGLAYSSRDIHHLLNVSSEKMGFSNSEHGGFYEWVRTNIGTVPQFSPRYHFKQYLIDCFLKLIDQYPERLQIIRKSVHNLLRTKEGFWVVTKDNHKFFSTVCILATGNPPFTKIGLPGNDSIIENIYDPLAMNRIKSQDRVLIAGTSLSMVDALLTLHHTKHQGPIIAFSRRGLIPHTHDTLHTPALIDWSDLIGKSWIRIFERFKKEIKNHPDKDWRSILDSIRPYTQRLWYGLSPAQKMSFLRHLRPFWDTHRHRIAEEAHQTVSAMVESTQLKIKAARLIKIQGKDPCSVLLKPRGITAIHEYRVDWIINCLGPDIHACLNRPLMQNLIKNGLATASPTGIGLLTDPLGRVSENLYAVGPVCRASLWECIAVPDIRIQAEQIVKTINI
ncbi:MAG: FAD/NAD(P)-binding protein [Candidatus Cloacimonetes bacterium]|nr:FAD/NAD(P)-binding protein [Candidatus Cloacimonadota bacterium]